MQVEIIGGPVSPYVRKVLAVCALKGIAYAIDPIIPLFGDEAFTRISPLRRIPALRDDRVEICDSSVISQYLEDRWPEPRLYPEDIGLRAKARWLEEFADTRLGDVIIWKLFQEAVVGPAMFGKPRDLDAIARIVHEDLPPLLDYLDGELTTGPFFCGALSIADVSVAVNFANLKWSRAQIDWARWPRLETWIARMRAETPIGRLEELGAIMVRTPIPDHRAKLAELGFATTEKTMATSTPQKGPMSV